MTIYFTSDLHLQHQNIISYCQRPFANIAEMDATLIANWNNRVQDSDLVYVIGDLVMGVKDNIPALIQQLRGQIILIAGNHDYDRRGQILKQYKQTKIWNSPVYSELYTEVDGIKLYLRHIPDTNFIPNERAQYHFTGHVHNAWVRQGSIENVGVDVCDYKPMTLSELFSRPQVIGVSHRTDTNLHIAHL